MKISTAFLEMPNMLDKMSRPIVAQAEMLSRAIDQMTVSTRALDIIDQQIERSRMMERTIDKINATSLAYQRAVDRVTEKLTATSRVFDAWEQQIKKSRMIDQVFEQIDATSRLYDRVAEQLISTSRSFDILDQRIKNSRMLERAIERITVTTGIFDSIYEQFLTLNPSIAETDLAEAQGVFDYEEIDPTLWFHEICRRLRTIILDRDSRDDLVKFAQLSLQILTTAILVVTFVRGCNSRSEIHNHYRIEYHFHVDGGHSKPTDDEKE